MSKILKIVILNILCLTLLSAVEEGDIKNIVNNAFKYCQDNGNEKCFETFSDKSSQFVDGELYVFVIDYKGTVLSHGGNAKLVGKNIIKLKEPSGKMLIQELINIAQNNKEGWYDYKWSNPVTQKIGDKRSYVQDLDGNSFIGAGYYKK